MLLFNFGQADFEVNEHDRIAQLIIEKYTMTSMVEVETLDETVRGDGGFGSTGVEGDKVENLNLKRQKLSEGNPV